MFVLACCFGGEEQSHPPGCGGAIEAANTMQMLQNCEKHNFYLNVEFI